VRGKDGVSAVGGRGAGPRRSQRVHRGLRIRRVDHLGRSPTRVRRTERRAAGACVPRERESRGEAGAAGRRGTRRAGEGHPSGGVRMSRAAALGGERVTAVGARAARYRSVMTGLGVAFVAAFLIGVAFGTVWISPWDTLRLVAWKLHLMARPH